jgi:hypothetical protein
MEEVIFKNRPITFPAELFAQPQIPQSAFNPL